MELTAEQAGKAFDSITRREMGIDGEEFLRRWDAGYYSERSMDDVPGLVEVWMALPLVR